MTPDHPLYTKISQLWHEPQVQTVVGIIDAVRLELFRAQKLQEVKKYTIDDVKDTLLCYLNEVGQLNAQNLATHMLVTEHHSRSFEIFSEFRHLVPPDIFRSLEAYHRVSKVEPAIFRDSIECALSSGDPFTMTEYAGWVCEFLTDEKIDQSAHTALHLDERISVRAMNVCEFCDSMIRHAAWRHLEHPVIDTLFNRFDQFAPRVKSPLLVRLMQEHTDTLKRAIAADHLPSQPSPASNLKTRVKNTFKMAV